MLIFHKNLVNLLNNKLKTKQKLINQLPKLLIIHKNLVNLLNNKIKTKQKLINQLPKMLIFHKNLVKFLNNKIYKGNHSIKKSLYKKESYK